MSYPSARSNFVGFPCLLSSVLCLGLAISIVSIKTKASMPHGFRPFKMFTRSEHLPLTAFIIPPLRNIERPHTMRRVKLTSWLTKNCWNVAGASSGLQTQRQPACTRSEATPWTWIFPCSPPRCKEETSVDLVRTVSCGRSNPSRYLSCLLGAKYPKQNNSGQGKIFQPHTMSFLRKKVTAVHRITGNSPPCKYNINSTNINWVT